MSQSRFSIVLVGVSALLRRPLVSRLRPADGERSPWVVFAARGCRFDSGAPLGGWPSGSLLSLFGTHRFGGALGGLAFGLTASELPFGGLPFGLIASAFRHAPIRRLPSAGWFFRLPFRNGCWAGWPSGSPLPLFGMRRFGVTLGGLVLPLGGLAFGLTASAFRHAPLRSCRSAGWFFRWAGWPSGSLLPLFGMHRFAPPHCRSEDRRSTPTRHLFHFKTLIPTC